MCAVQRRVVQAHAVQNRVVQLRTIQLHAVQQDKKYSRADSERDYETDNTSDALKANRKPANKSIKQRQ